MISPSGLALRREHCRRQKSNEPDRTRRSEGSRAHGSRRGTGESCSSRPTEARGREAIVKLFAIPPRPCESVRPRALHPYGAEAKEAVPVLSLMMADRDLDARIASMDALGRAIGPAAAEVIPRLQIVIRNANATLVQSATDALAKVRHARPNSRSEGAARSATWLSS